MLIISELYYIIIFDNNYYRDKHSINHKFVWTNIVNIHDPLIFPER